VPLEDVRELVADEVYLHHGPDSLLRAPREISPAGPPHHALEDRPPCRAARASASRAARMPAPGRAPAPDLADPAGSTRAALMPGVHAPHLVVRARALVDVPRRHQVLERQPHRTKMVTCPASVRPDFVPASTSPSSAWMASSPSPTPANAPMRASAPGGHRRRRTAAGARRRPRPGRARRPPAR
jgi:hypothetical protein